MDAAIVGFGLGFAVALQLGPMSLFLIRSTLRAGWRAGLAAGAGIAVVDALYAACGVAGAAPLLSLASARTALGLAGAALLLWLGAGRTLHAAFALRSGLEGARESASPRRAFGLALAGTASNPATIISWAALFAAAHSTASVHGTRGAVLLVAEAKRAAQEMIVAGRGGPASASRRARGGPLARALQAAAQRGRGVPASSPRATAAAPRRRARARSARGEQRAAAAPRPGPQAASRRPRGRPGAREAHRRRSQHRRIRNSASAELQATAEPSPNRRSPHPCAGSGAGARRRSASQSF